MVSLTFLIVLIIFSSEYLSIWLFKGYEFIMSINSVLDDYFNNFNTMVSNSAHNGFVYSLFSHFKLYRFTFN
jgi:hypothetical protein